MENHGNEDEHEEVRVEYFEECLIVTEETQEIEKAKTEIENILMKPQQ